MWQVKEIETLFVGVFPLEKGSALDVDAWIHLSRNSGNTGWDVDRKKEGETAVYGYNPFLFWALSVSWWCLAELIFT